MRVRDAMAKDVFAVQREELMTRDFDRKTNKIIVDVVWSVALCGVECGIVCCGV